jgi:hypothetical protein
MTIDTWVMKQSDCTPSQALTVINSFSQQGNFIRVSRWPALASLKMASTES